jgi:hypothetical protein
MFDIDIKFSIKDKVIVIVIEITFIIDIELNN